MHVYHIYLIYISYIICHFPCSNHLPTWLYIVIYNIDQLLYVYCRRLLLVINLTYISIIYTARHNVFSTVYVPVDQTSFENYQSL